MTDEELYKAAVGFLLSFNNITVDDVNRHLQSDYNKPDDLGLIYKQLCETAQNKQMSAQVIGKSIGGIDKLSKILFNFEPHLVANMYKKNESTSLLNQIKNVLKPMGQIRDTSRSLWPQFCQSVIDAAHFLKTFTSAKEFYSWADFFANDERARPALPLMISIEIKGIGFPLACDFLKEIGYADYSKPDVHLIEIFKTLNIINPSEKAGIRRDFSIVRAIDRIAKRNNTTAYAVDKVFWLIGSGNFYSTNKRIGRQREKFLNYIRDISKK